jgi:hypothetical protein
MLESVVACKLSWHQYYNHVLIGKILEQISEIGNNSSPAGISFTSKFVVENSAMIRKYRKNKDGLIYFQSTRQV